MQRKLLVLGVVAASLLIGCGGPVTEEENELAGVDASALSEQASSAKKEPGPVIQSFQIIGPQALGTFPSWWPGSTKIRLQGYGTSFEATPVHMWCTTGSNDVYFTVYPDQFPGYSWYCYGRTIYVRNLGTNSNQTIQVTTE